MSLDVYLNKLMPCHVYENNITHNLVPMAEDANLYGYLWRPEENGITKASQLITPLQQGLDLLKSDPERFRKFNPVNGWGNYEGLINFVEDYLTHCIENPDTDVQVSR